METISVHPKPRPALLTVLCVLTFVGSGLSLMGNLMSMFIAPFMDFSILRCSMKHFHI